MTTKKATHGGFRWRSENPRSARVEVRFTPEEKETLVTAAEHTGVGASVAARAAALEWARAVLARRVGK